MMVFNVCVNDTVQLLHYILVLTSLWRGLIDHLTLITAVIVYYNATNQILILQKVSKLR